MNSEQEKRLKDLRSKRPKEGSYPTFTVAVRAESRIPYRKIEYADGVKGSARKVLTEQIPVTIQRGIEFDVYRECLGSRDGKVAPNPRYLKLVLEGFRQDGKIVLLDPDDLQKNIEERLGSDTNRIILWKDRPRPENEKRMEAAMEKKDAEINSRDMSINTLRNLLKGRGMKDEEIEAAIAKAG